MLKSKKKYSEKVKTPANQSQTQISHMQELSEEIIKITKVIVQREKTRKHDRLC